MRISAKYGRRTAAFASAFLVWMAVASGVVPLLHHAGGHGSSGCEDAAAPSYAAAALHASDCPHGEEHHADGVDSHCPVCRTLQQSGAAAAAPAERAKPFAWSVRCRPVPPDIGLDPDLPVALSPRAPPRFA